MHPFARHAIATSSRLCPLEGVVVGGIGGVVVREVFAGLGGGRAVEEEVVLLAC